MKKLILLALLSINLFALDTKKIILHNSTPFSLSLAFVYYDGSDWVSIGWYTLKSNQDRILYTKSNIFYYRANSYYNNFIWEPPSFRQVYKEFYITNDAFTIKSLSPKPNARLEKFLEVRIPKNSEPYVFNITYDKDDIHFKKPQDCVCHDDYISLKNSINPSRKAVDMSTAKTLSNALSTLPTTDYCSKQASSIIYMDSKSYSLLAESMDKCGESGVKAFMTGLFEPWKVLTTCPDIRDKYKKLSKKWLQQVKLYDEWYQGNCTK